MCSIWDWWEHFDKGAQSTGESTEEKKKKHKQMVCLSTAIAGIYIMLLH